MAEYIERKALIDETRKRIENAHSYRMAVVDNEFLEIIEDVGIADVVPKKEIANVLCDLKIAVHNKAMHPNSSGIPSYIPLKTFDAVVQGFINKFDWRK